MEEGMAYSTIGRGLALASALAVGVAFIAAPTTAEARISTGAAVGIGLGSFALGTALGSAAAYPYYGGGYYGAGYGGYPYGGYTGYGYPAYGYGGYTPAYGGYYGSSYAPYYGAGWGY
jgi:hypothetical protein